MKKEELLSTFDLADEKFIAEASDLAVTAHFKQVRSRFIALAACLALVFLIGIGGGIYYTVDIIRYNDAVSYLTQHGYSVDGLTKSEILEIYNSISSQITSSDLEVYVSNLISEMISSSSSEPSSPSSPSSSSSPSSDNEGEKPLVSIQSGGITSGVNSEACLHGRVGFTVEEIQATCISPGQHRDMVCLDCGYVLIPVTQTPVSETHTFTQDGGVCVLCGYTFDVSKYLTFELNSEETGYVFNGLDTDSIPCDLFGGYSYLPNLQITVPDTYNGLPVIGVDRASSSYLSEQDSLFKYIEKK